MLEILWYGILTYWGVSLFFLIFPNILHPRKTYKSKVLQAAVESKGEKVLHFSHRGGSRERVENTIEAFQNAVYLSVDNGSHILEFDLQQTKDGVVIVAHDANLLRLCGVNKEISQINYSDLPRFSEEIMLHFSDAMMFKHESSRSAYFPTLEVFRNCFSLLKI